MRQLDSVLSFLIIILHYFFCILLFKCYWGISLFIKLIIDNFNKHISNLTIPYAMLSMLVFKYNDYIFSYAQNIHLKISPFLVSCHQNTRI